MLEQKKLFFCIPLNNKNTIKFLVWYEMLKLTMNIIACSSFP